MNRFAASPDDEDAVAEHERRTGEIERTKRLLFGGKLRRRRDPFLSAGVTIEADEFRVAHGVDAGHHAEIGVVGLPHHAEHTVIRQRERALLIVRRGDAVGGVVAVALAVIGRRPTRQRQTALEADSVDARVVLEKHLAAVDHRHDAGHHAEISIVFVLRFLLVSAGGVARDTIGRIFGMTIGTVIIRRRRSLQHPAPAAIEAAEGHSPFVLGGGDGERRGVCNSFASESASDNLFAVNGRLCVGEIFLQRIGHRRGRGIIAGEVICERGEIQQCAVFPRE